MFANDFILNVDIEKKTSVTRSVELSGYVKIDFALTLMNANVKSFTK